jgi:hypothetical protein
LARGECPDGQLVQINTWPTRSKTSGSPSNIEKLQNTEWK